MSLGLKASSDAQMTFYSPYSLVRVSHLLGMDLLASFFQGGVFALSPVIIVRSAWIPELSNKWMLSNHQNENGNWGCGRRQEDLGVWVGLLDCWSQGFGPLPSPDTSPYCCMFPSSAYDVSCSGSLGLSVSQCWKYAIKLERNKYEIYEWPKRPHRLGWALVVKDPQFCIGLCSGRSDCLVGWGGVGWHAFNENQIFLQKKRGW